MTQSRGREAPPQLAKDLEVIRRGADEEHDVMPEVLELPHLVEHHGVSQMQIGSGRIETRLYPEGLALRELAAQCPVELGVSSGEFRQPSTDLGDEWPRNVGQLLGAQLPISHDQKSSSSSIEYFRLH